MQNKPIVYITGGIASGKSTLVDMIKEMGYRVIDADRIARDLMAIGGKNHQSIVGAFGIGVLDSTGRINRGVLADVVFSDPEELKRLNEATHPAIYEAIENEIVEALVTCDRVFVDIPLYFEGRNAYPLPNGAVWVVYLSEDLQMARLMKRNDYSTEEARRRIMAQMPLIDKAHEADVVFNNSGDVEDLRKLLLKEMENL